MDHSSSVKLSNVAKQLRHKRSADFIVEFGHRQFGHVAYANVQQAADWDRQDKAKRNAAAPSATPCHGAEDQGGTVAS